MVNRIIEEVEGFYRIIALQPFRRTEGVAFDLIPMEFLPKIDGIDRVIHQRSAISPGPVGAVERPWYLHPNQADNLIVMAGRRTVEVFTLKHRRIETFVVEPELILKNGKTLYEGPAMLVWPCNVFHRIVSGENGSASLNFAARFDGFDLRTNFSIYDLDTGTGGYSVIREGHLDQSPS